MIVIKQKTCVKKDGEHIYTNVEYRVFADDDVKGVQEYLNTCLGEVEIQKV